MFVGGLSCLTFIRAPCLLRDLYKEQWAEGRRRVCFQQFIMALLDVLCVFVFFAVCVTGYRLPGLMAILRDVNTVGFFSRSSYYH
jgi:hypothetical protein